MGLHDLPQFNVGEVVKVLDRRALKSQRLYQLIAVYQILLLLVASVVSTIPYHTGRVNLSLLGTGRVNLSLLGAAGCYIAVVVLQLVTVSAHWEEGWHRTRAAADRLISLSWLYAVGGEPFGLSSDPTSVQDSFAQQIAATYKDLNLPIPEGTLFSPALQNIRYLSFPDRCTVYVAGRIRDQQRYYVYRARQNRRRARLWNAITLLLQLFVVLALLTRAIDVVEVDLYSLVIALAGAGATYAQNKQFSTLADEFGVHTRQIAVLEARFKELAVTTEHDWGAAVSEAENLISQTVR